MIPHVCQTFQWFESNASSPEKKKTLESKPGLQSCFYGNKNPVEVSLTLGEHYSHFVTFLVSSLCEL